MSEKPPGDRKEGIVERLRRFAADTNESVYPGAKPIDETPLDDAINRSARNLALAGTIAANVLTFPSMAGAETRNRSQHELSQDQRNLDRLFAKIDQSPSIGLEKKNIDTALLTEEDRKCLAENVYHEARGEPEEGRFAVMFTTLSRMFSPTKEFPKSVCGVVYQPWQFSWTMDAGLRAAPRNEMQYAKIMQEVASITNGTNASEAAILAGMKAGLPAGALYYKQAGFKGSPKVQAFFGSLKSIGVIGHHEYFVKIDKK
jgi:spore germination cell wall hydrolase CwlJ-like protein